MATRDRSDENRPPISTPGMTAAPPPVSRRGPPDLVPFRETSSPAVPRSVGGGREVLGERRGDLDEAPTCPLRHLGGHVDNPAGTQVRVERHLDDDLTATGELLHQNRAGPLVGVAVGVVEHN